MKTLTIILGLLCCASSVLAQDTTPAPATKAAQPQPEPTQPTAATILHLPLNEALTGNVSLTFDVRDPQLAGKLIVHVLRAGKPASEIEALRTERAHVAVLGAELVTPPGFAYFVTERMPDRSERAVFADARAPHFVRVTHPPELELELERLGKRGGERSTLLLAADVIDYGDRRLAGTLAHDRYYRLEAGYAYAVLTRVESIRLSLVRVRGEAALWNGGFPGSATLTAPGIDFGRAEVGLQLAEQFRLRGAILLGASQRGFEYGGGGGITLGDPRDVNLDFGAERITTLGTTARLRLGFPAHERVPMGAGVEVSSFPIGDDSGVRLLYDVGYRFGPVTQLVVQLGYQGRTSVSGGPSLGARFDYGF